jgi:hypothetical protein
VQGGLVYLADDKELEITRVALVQEATELTSILGSIVRKSE